MNNLLPSSHSLSSVFLMPVGIHHVVPIVGKVVSVLLFSFQRLFLYIFWAARKASWFSFLVILCRVNKSLVNLGPLT